MSSQKSMMQAPAYIRSQGHKDRAAGDDLEQAVTDRSNAATVQIVLILLFLILAIALFSFLLLYQRVSI